MDLVCRLRTCGFLAQHVPHLADNFLKSGLGQLAFPHDHHAKGLRLKVDSVPYISFTGLFNLLCPKGGVRFGSQISGAVRAAVPEAPVDEDGKFALDEQDIGFTWITFRVFSIPSKSGSPKGFSKHLFGKRFRSSIALHRLSNRLCDDKRLPQLRKPLRIFDTLHRAFLWPHSRCRMILYFHCD